MSGGSYNYAFSHVDDMAGTLLRSRDPLRRAFGEHLRKVAKAMHDVEWVDSGDYGDGGEVEAINDVLQPGAELSAAVGIAKEALDALSAAIQRSEEDV